MITIFFGIGISIFIFFLWAIIYNPEGSKRRKLDDEEQMRFIKEYSKNKEK